MRSDYLEKKLLKNIEDRLAILKIKLNNDTDTVLSNFGDIAHEFSRLESTISSYESEKRLKVHERIHELSK